MSKATVLLGRITSAHGLKGEVKIATFTAQTEDITAYGALTATGGRTVEIMSLRAASVSSVIATVKGVSDRTGAEALCGLDLYVARDALPPADEGEYYQSDLIGLSALSVEGEKLGDVIAVHNFGAGDMLEVRPTASNATQIVPFTTHHVPSVDLANRRVVIVPPVFVADDAS